MKTLKNIKKKLGENHAIIAKSDKGNSTVIITVDEYNQKLHDFITSNNFNSIRSEPTNKFQTKVRELIRKSTHLIQDAQKWQNINLNPTTPTIKGLIKIHKIDHPIIPIVNRRNVPAYKLAKLFNNRIYELSPLPLVFNIKNTTHLTKSLKEITLNANSRL
jgi:hypothetical protein